MSVIQNNNEFEKLIELYEKKRAELKEINEEIQAKMKEVKNATNRKNENNS